MESTDYFLVGLIFLLLQQYQRNMRHFYQRRLREIHLTKKAMKWPLYHKISWAHLEVPLRI